MCHAQSLQLEFRATCGRLSSRAHHRSFRNNRRVSIILCCYIRTYVYPVILLHRYKTWTAAAAIVVHDVLRRKSIKSRRCETTILWRHIICFRRTKLNSTCTYVLQQYDIIILYIHSYYNIHY